jgi:XTP/dITP diphosphohydrolase
MTLYAATSNPGKLAEFATSASSSGIAVLPLPNLASIAEPIEDADTFQGNADLKARAYSLTLPNELVFADDSGLVVDALRGAPGVRSARYADDLHFEPGLGTKDDRNNHALLAQLGSNPDRTARFVCTLALARNGEILLRAEGFSEGEILSAPRGAGGFGYDPLFLLPDLGLTMAELPRDPKWQLSHRGNAFRLLLSRLIGTDFDNIAQPAR